MKKNLLYSILGVLALVACWIVAYFVLRNDYLLPSPWDTVVAMGELFVNGEFYLAVLNTLWRTLLSFAVSFLLGIALALCSVFWGWVRAFLAPVLSFFRTLPTMAFMLLLLIWTNPRFAPVIVTSLVLFPVVYSEALACFDGVKAEYGTMLQAYRVSRAKQLVNAYMPLPAPVMLAQVGSLLSMGLKVTVSAEVLALTYRSLGGMMTDAQVVLQTKELLALTVVTVLLGFALELAGLLVKKKVVRWRNAV